ncbi:hypothetical protein OCO53_25675 [Peribacillus frigoritolerans]|uniref:defense against restriction DarA-related protein n=1 Tax=Peribacillus frigoritolerans TaxID=450367 RepID=UPI0021D25FF9|nr:hypothetical protein [Peribacillus frigoritolerans]MCU6603834.1 hypothetical protein [Peribacillus frigoritolerans]
MENMKMKELIAMAKDMGITFKVGTKKVDFIEIIKAEQKRLEDAKKAQEPKLVCGNCKCEYKKHGFTYPELCVDCSDIKMMDDIDEEVAFFENQPETKAAPKKKAQPKLHWYEYQYRGFSIGCQPNGFVKNDPEHGKFGAIAYERKLTDEELESFELKSMTKSKSSAPIKFTDEQVRYIRAEVAGGRTKKSLAEEFGVSWNSIHYIIIKKFYADVA